MNPLIARLLVASASMTPAFAQTPSTPFCLGDGTGAACPCANIGPAGTGCGNSFGGIIQLSSSGIAGASIATDTLVLSMHSSSINSSWGYFFQGTSAAAGGAGFPFGDGLMCVDGTILRLGIVFLSSGVASFPGGITPAPIHLAGNTSPGDVRYYQCMYRDNALFCSPATNNLSHGLTLTWGP